MNDALLQEAIAAARSGERERARRLLSQLVQREPQNEQAWLWLSGLLDDPARAVYCLQRVLAINPENIKAREGLAWATRASNQPSQTAPATPPELKTRVVEKPVEVDPLAIEPPPAVVEDLRQRQSAYEQTPPGSPRERLSDAAGAPLAPASRDTDQKPGPRPVAPTSEPASADDLRALLVPEQPATSRNPTRSEGLANRALLTPAQPSATLLPSAGSSGMVLAQAPASTTSDQALMTSGEALSYMLLLGAVLGLNISLWELMQREVASFGAGLLLAALGTLIVTLALLPLWGALVGLLALLGGAALDRRLAARLLGEALFPGFIAGLAFLCGLAGLLLPAQARLFALGQQLLLLIALAAIPLSLYRRLSRTPELAGQAATLSSAALMVLLLLGGAMGALGQLLFRQL